MNEPSDLDTMELEAEALWDMTQAPTMETPKKRGRPKGSRNKARTSGQISGPGISGLSDHENVNSFGLPDDVDIPPEMREALEAFNDDAQPKPRGGARLTKLEKRLRETYMGIGFAVSYVNAQDGLIIVSMANARAHEVYQYAQSHPEFKYYLETLLERSDLLMLVTGHLTLAGAIMRNHGLIPQDVGKSLLANIKRRISVKSEKERPQHGRFGPFQFRTPGSEPVSEFERWT